MLSALQIPSLRLPLSQPDLFTALNAVVEPNVRKGWGSPWLLQPVGLIVVEMVTRRSHRRVRVPLAALRVGDSVVVSTVRSRQSQWLRNLAATPEVRYWIGGKPRRARAVVYPAGAGKQHDSPPGRAVPVSGAVRALLVALTPYRRAGLGVAVLTPA